MAPRKKSGTRSRGQVDSEKKILQLDREILKLINERAKAFQRWAKTVGDLPGGIDELALTELIERSRGPLDEGSIRAIFQALMSGSKGLLSKTRVAYLGPQHSYSHQAAMHFFGSGHDLVPATTIASVFDEVNRHQVNFGVVPLENSTDGRVTDTLDKLVKIPVRICGEVQLRIHHYLLAKCPRGQITEVYSKPQALSQCRDWLGRHMPGTRLVEMASTAAAAKLASEKKGAAAIASRMAGVQYGLDVIESDIEDNKSNTTRFAVIGESSPPKTSNDKTSLMFEISHRPGALADAMMAFKTCRLNLTWIESFPMPESKNEYFFFVEFEGHETSSKVKNVLKELEEITSRHVVLGSYPWSQPVE